MAEIFNERLERVAQKLFDEQIELIKEAQSVGHMDLAEYKLSSGRIIGLKMAKTLLEQALTDSMRS